MKTLKTALIGSVLLVAAAPAMAQSVTATVATDLNLRSGPGAWYESVAVIPANAEASVEGCLAEVDWCQVTYEGQSGWSYAPYLAVADGDVYAALSAAPTSVTVKTVTTVDQAATDEDKGAAALAGGSAGALIAYALGGPVTGMVIGGILGSSIAAEAVEPTTETVTYIQQNPVEVVWLDGEAVVGAALPTGIVTYETPQAGVRYLNVNGTLVAVDAESNVIVDVIS